MSERVKVGVIGCGDISGAYFRGCAPYDVLEIVACADLDLDRAKAKVEEFGVSRACTTEELLADPDIEVVLNLTTPGAHAPVNLAAIAAGKSVYVEKPLAVNRDKGLRTIEAAKKQGVLVGCAPDTFLGGGGQTCRKLIDDGAIGEIVSAVAFCAGRGHEHWHPSPEFYYKRGGGPMFDMGPYFLTALVNLMGRAVRVSGSTKITHPTRTITSEPLSGTVIDVETPTHLTGTIDFESGAVATVITSFDVRGGHHLPVIEIYGTEGTLGVPDPNGFGGTVLLRGENDEDWREIPLTHSDEVRRGIGVADLAVALRTGRAHRASGELAYHVLDLMQAFEESSESGRHVPIQSTCERPAPLPTGLKVGEID